MIPAIEEERKKERKWLEYLRYLCIYRMTNTPPTISCGVAKWKRSTRTRIFGETEV